MQTPPSLTCLLQMVPGTENAWGGALSQGRLNYRTVNWTCSSIPLGCSPCLPLLMRGDSILNKCLLRYDLSEQSFEIWRWMCYIKAKRCIEGIMVGGNLWMIGGLRLIFCWNRWDFGKEERWETAYLGDCDVVLCGDVFPYDTCFLWWPWKDWTQVYWICSRLHQRNCNLDWPNDDEEGLLENYKVLNPALVAFLCID